MKLDLDNFDKMLESLPLDEFTVDREDLEALIREARVAMELEDVLNKIEDIIGDGVFNQGGVLAYSEAIQSWINTSRARAAKIREGEK